jgi:hypothetical protein
MLGRRIPGMAKLPRKTANGVWGHGAVQETNHISMVDAGLADVRMARFYITRRHRLGLRMHAC